MLDLREKYDYGFLDVNHRSQKGAHDLAVDYFLPIVEEHAGTDHAVTERHSG